MGIMDISEVEENLFAASDAKLHESMCKLLSSIYCRVFGMFPVLESVRPQSKSGIQALCSLHLALEKAKTILQHCSDCSKLYLAITGDSVVLKFEKARSALADSLRRVEDIVPESIGCKISEIVGELDRTVFSLDSSEKQIGDQIIALLQQGRKFDVDCSDHNKLELFHQAALRLGITSSRAALIERRSLKKLIERARVEEDKRKESIVAYLLHLMRKYSKLFRSELGDDHDSSQGSSPRSPTLFKESFENGGPACERAFSRLSSFNFKPSNNMNFRRSGNLPLPPEELRCPISLQLMYDPVIIDSGQTYERVCIEKWFSDSHNTCPKTQQHLSHLCLTPNYCVKGLISSWCEQNGVPIPSAPPDSLDLNYWRLALSETDSMNSQSIGSIGSCKLKAAPVEEESGEDGGREVNVLEKCESFLSVLGDESAGLMEKCRVVEHLRNLLKEDDEARILMGRNGFVEVLVGFLESALAERNELAQEIGAMALFNLAVNNNRNKQTMLSGGVMGLLEKMSDPCCSSHGSATALYLNLSCLEEAKPLIGGSSVAVPFLVKLLESVSEPQQCKVDALHALFNLSTHPGNILPLLKYGIVSTLCELLRIPWEAEKSIGVLMNVGSTKGGREEMRLVPGVIRGLAGVVERGEGREAEDAAGCLLVVCSGDERCSQLVLQEGVIPALVDASVNGSARGREKAQKLLMLFREQRQREMVQAETEAVVEKERRGGEGNDTTGCVKRVGKSASRRRVMGRAWMSLWKSKSVSTATTYQC